MPCKLCGRESGPFCTGCRTVSRLKWLWESRLGLGDNPEALSALRNCAGALTDLAEVYEANRQAALAATGALAPAPIGHSGDKKVEGDIGAKAARGEAPQPPAAGGIRLKEEPKSETEEEESEEEIPEEELPAAKATPLEDSSKGPEQVSRRR